MVTLLPSHHPSPRILTGTLKPSPPHFAPHSPTRWVLGGADVDWQSVQTVSSLQSSAGVDELHCSADNQQETKEVRNINPRGGETLNATKLKWTDSSVELNEGEMSLPITTPTSMTVVEWLWEALEAGTTQWECWERKRAGTQGGEQLDLAGLNTASTASQLPVGFLLSSWSTWTPASGYF